MIFLKFLVMALTRDRWSLTCRLLRTDYLRHVREPFPGCGNRRKGGIARPEADHFLGRLDLPCIKTYMESFPRIAGRHMNFNCYSYGAGDCLPTHDDTAPTGQAARSVYGVPLRRLALTTYLHEEWHPPQTRISRAVHGTAVPSSLPGGPRERQSETSLHCRVVYDSGSRCLSSRRSCE